MKIPGTKYSVVDNTIVKKPYHTKDGKINVSKMWDYYFPMDKYKDEM